MMSSEQRLVEIALAIADGRRVEWPAETPETDAADLEGLRMVEAIAAAHHEDPIAGLERRGARRSGGTSTGSS